jgi:hypothetical protein
VEGTSNLGAVLVPQSLTFADCVFFITVFMATTGGLFCFSAVLKKFLKSKVGNLKEGKLKEGQVKDGQTKEEKDILFRLFVYVCQE